MRLLYGLRLSYVASETVKEQRLRSTPLVPAHYAVLINVRNAPGITASALARLLGVTPQNVAGLAKRLEQSGFLERKPHGLHTHVTELRLTEAGAAALTEADRKVAELEAHLTDRLGPERSARLVEDLREVQQIMQELNGDFKPSSIEKG